MQSSRHQAPGIEESLGLCLFGLIGLAMLSAPIWAYRRAFKIVYVITDRRAIIFTWGWLGKIQSFTPDQLKKTYRKEKDDGTGDVVLEKEVVFDPNIMGNGKGATYNEVGFLRVRDARKVEQMVKDLCEKGGTIVV